MDNTLFSRIIHTHDIERNWNKTNGFIPKAGEFIVYDCDNYHSYPRFKLGDGKKDVKELPFVEDTFEELILKNIFTVNESHINLTGGCITEYTKDTTSDTEEDQNV